MGKVIAGMTVSLDGYINDKNGNAGSINPDFSELLNASSFKQMIEDTGAVVMGRHVYEMADPFAWINDDYEFQVPLFIVTHMPPEKFPQGNGRLTVNFVTDGIENAVAQAKRAAGDKDVQIIGGADTIQQCLNAGLCDELQIDIVPVLVGEGLKLFENLDTEKIRLQRIKVETPTSARTSIYFKVTRLHQ